MTAGEADGREPNTMDPGAQASRRESGEASSKDLGQAGFCSIGGQIVLLDGQRGIMVCGIGVRGGMGRMGIRRVWLSQDWQADGWHGEEEAWWFEGGEARFIILGGWIGGARQRSHPSNNSHLRHPCYIQRRDVQVAGLIFRTLHTYLLHVLGSTAALVLVRARVELVGARIG